MRREYKDSRRRAYRRKIMLARAILIMAVMAFLMIVMLALKPTVNGSGVYVTHTVASGETLWSICREFYGNSVDIRPLISHTMNENGISNPSELTAGRVIMLEVIE